MSPHVEPWSHLSRGRVVGRVVSFGLALIGVLALVSDVNDAVFSDAKIVPSDVGISLAFVIFGLALYFFLEFRANKKEA